jgi:hypothetical protein
MKLSAVTICVHESDSLACTLGNRDQFDRWLIVTAPKDRDTIAFCRKHGLECRVTGGMGADGEDALMSENRARALAEGMSAIGADGWVAMLGSCVLLPRTFRAQLAAMPLSTECGFRIDYRSCDNRRKAERLKWCEPWRADAATPDEPDLHFQLIHAGFGDAGVRRPRRAGLPMSALLLGAGALHWGAGIRAEERLPNADPRGAALRDLLAGAGGKSRMLVAGYHPGMDFGAWSPLCAQILVTDDFGLRARDGGERAAAQAALRSLWQAEVAGLDNLIELDEAAAASVPDRSLDALYLPGEATVPRLIAGLPLWRRVLKDGALVCGDLYGRPDWPEASLAIAQLFGTPDGVSPSGFWHGRFDPARLPAAPVERGAPAIVMINPPGGDRERLLTSLTALRSHWPGPVIVEDSRPTDPALMAACARLGATLRPADGAARIAAWNGPGLVLKAGVLAQRPLGPLLDRATAPPALAAVRRTAARSFKAIAKRLGRANIQPLPPANLVRSRDWVKELPVAEASALADLPPALQPTLVWYEESGAESPAAVRLRERSAAAMRATLTPPIRVAADSTIVALVRRERLAQFRLNWPTWNFGGAPVLVACEDFAPADIAWLSAPPQRVVPLAQSEIADPRRLLGALLDRVATPRVILLPESARAEPGAELFAARSWGLEPAALHSTVEVRRVNGTGPGPRHTEPLVLSIAADHARRLSSPAPAAGAGFDGWLMQAVTLAGGWSICNVESWGWRLR